MEYAHCEVFVEFPNQGSLCYCYYYCCYSVCLFNGICSQTTTGNLVIASVLILVLMEYTLRDANGSSSK